MGRQKQKHSINFVQGYSSYKVLGLSVNLTYQIQDGSALQRSKSDFTPCHKVCEEGNRQKVSPPSNLVPGPYPENVHRERETRPPRLSARQRLLCRLAHLQHGNREHSLCAQTKFRHLPQYCLLWKVQHRYSDGT